MENPRKPKYRYFKRDISWLSFNFRVLLEAKDKSLPLYERVKFLSIFSSNLEEFYKVRVSGYHSSLVEDIKEEETVEEALETLSEIKREVMQQEEEYYRIFDQEILPELKENNITLYQSDEVLPFHREFVSKYFNEEVFPYLVPMIIQKDYIHSFILDARIYQVISLLPRKKKDTEILSNDYTYVIMKIPFTKVPRFIELPSHNGMHYIMFIDDIIRANLSSVFPGYKVGECYSLKISRDADFSIEDEDYSNLAERILKKVRKRKIGAVTRFQYDKAMPDYFLKYLCDTYEIEEEELLPSGRYLNLHDLMDLPNPTNKKLTADLPQPLEIPEFEKNSSLLRVLRKKDILMHFPYQSFNYLIRFLMQAAFDPKVLEIKVTQYRVAENSAVINSLISAAKNGKRVTVFVELKARFDEEHNFETAETMQQAGIKIIYSLQGLKVHAKLAYVRKRSKNPTIPIKGYAYLSTGNFNEKTALIYSDMGLLTSNQDIINEMEELFNILEGRKKTYPFNHLLVAQFNMLPMLHNMIDREIAHVENGDKGRIILKMNSLQDMNMIERLYEASSAGVEIDLIIRGICCLVPNQPYSQNIKITRIVDSYLEHTRIWYFHNNGNPTYYLTSADWMERNLMRRIETAFPIYSEKHQQQIMDFLTIQLSDNVKACIIDENLNNIFKTSKKPKVRTQRAFHSYLKKETEANKQKE
ncbi:MAG: polyphosphate kinase 1 [Bacteroidales bacterium]|nr:polyphosphate kinase 1 [Bacteroidales bacterium]